MNRPFKRKPQGRRPGPPGFYRRDRLDRRLARKIVSAPDSGTLAAMPVLPEIHPTPGQTPAAALEALDEAGAGSPAGSGLQAIASEDQIDELRRDINAARDLQLRMLPARPPRIQGYEVSAFFDACDLLAGDFFQFIDAGAGRTGFLVADVAGHGLTAAMLMACTIKTFALRGRGQESPKAVLSAVYHELAQDLPPGRFITVFYAVLDHASGELRYARAGHNPAMLFRPEAGGVEDLREGGLALGLGGPERFTERLAEGRATLSPGSALLLYSDGITEGRNTAGAPYGEERLRTCFHACSGQRSRPIVERIIEDMRGHVGMDSGEDDLTLMVVKRE